MTCIVKQYGCSCSDQCQSFQARNEAMEKRHSEQRRKDAKQAVNMVVAASMLILVAMAVGMAFVHADEKFAQQEKIEAV